MPPQLPLERAALPKLAVAGLAQHLPHQSAPILPSGLACCADLDELSRALMTALLEAALPLLPRKPRRPLAVRPLQSALLPETRVARATQHVTDEPAPVAISGAPPGLDRIEVAALMWTLALLVRAPPLTLIAPLLGLLRRLVLALELPLRGVLVEAILAQDAPLKMPPVVPPGPRPIRHLNQVLPAAATLIGAQPVAVGS
eukprot:CAMPEP_0206233008 /NCGR_PEP_ID=MMETSP0047_2-20121206/11738_1 /ASSEMBLY_ACC=CAM_ASM_000192 /TAXON_ID=195065 /ORGANISM="Chroomonas mesostigmatica_cf, Strain CCMP1168" /LENGTH=200 /DNA_ID=CAMNT_0053656819 /DNA_START=1004 /DNA_END=1606 /DNA_ORIENTATION=-